jgi:hypothetical protein
LSTLDFPFPRFYDLREFFSFLQTHIFYQTHKVFGFLRVLCTAFSLSTIPVRVLFVSPPTAPLNIFRAYAGALAVFLGRKVFEARNLTLQL